MDDGDSIVHIPLLDEARARACYCPSNWFHKYSHCIGTAFPHFHLPEDEIRERKYRLETAFRDNREMIIALEQYGYWDMWQALMFHNKDTFLWFLQMEPNRLQYYWNSRTMIPTDYFMRTNACLASAFLRLCNIGIYVLGKLLRPDIWEMIYGEPITQYASDSMIRAKHRYSQVLDDVTQHGVQYGDLEVSGPIYQFQRTNNSSNAIAVPATGTNDSGQDSDHITIDESRISSPVESEQEWQDSGEFVDGTNQDVVEMELGPSSSDQIESQSIPIYSDTEDEGEIFDTSENDRVSAEQALEDVPDANEQQHLVSDESQVQAEERDSNFEEVQVPSNTTTLDLPHGQDESNVASNQAHDSTDLMADTTVPDANEQQDLVLSDESQVLEEEADRKSEEAQGPSNTTETFDLLHGQDESNVATDQAHDSTDPMADTAELSEQLIQDLNTLPDSGFEIAQQHPETVLALQLILALGRTIQARNEQQDDAD